VNTPNLNKLTGEPRRLCEEVAALIDEQVFLGALTVEGSEATIAAPRIFPEVADRRSGSQSA
jgi:hypothetical protein